MGAVSGLGLDGWVPPGVEVHDDIGAGEVEAGAAGLEGKQKYRDRRVVLEAVDLRLPLARRHRAIEVAVRDLLPVEFGAHEGEQRGELGKDQHAVAVVDGLVEQLLQHRELGRGIGRRRGVDETRIAAHLAQAQQLGEGGEAQAGLAGALGGEIEEGALGRFLQLPV